ncbi:hypothetical protein COEREDRAFT_41657 [Coemansia reversa NRRL 1564]|uniref:Dol-P-Glc:Glc(2)Man(9)GlcNAc(2)-PP-Dol alpha-1,2-glucosyltransferase n=1 Tax=Coemansia reversa (strain ATCC 12441 / NRRL 1564) TaxID=763665 RepID=A0A2G5BEJ2_COERN|nr:hypothetical protein COEREDRAFT_41657 [Coemansia reversa NRRL 1564]|eukprot:PIA17127.1 hypothetical protein COEREDRAFT_41657 [Coemansia reversa NRRL 1564]
MRQQTAISAGSVFVVYALVSYSVLQKVNSTVKEPYMDEIFHVRQAQHYCKGDFDVWEPKLTTPPGLYLISLVLNMSLTWIMGNKDMCTIESLRITNWLLGLVLFWIIFGLVQQLHNTISIWQKVTSTLTLSLFPISFFFHHLYYTDTGSLLLVLLMYFFSLRQYHFAAGITGFCALWLRQTNVVWVGLVGFSAGISWFQNHRNIIRPKDSLSKSLLNINSWAIQQIGKCEDREILKVLIPYGIVIGVFGVFLISNGGIVLGDKAHHQAGMHVPQLFYFYAYMAAMTAPVILPLIISRFWQCGKLKPSNLVLGGLLAVVMTISVSSFTMEHPFLLSDNRHYTFYLWKDIFQRHWSIRYLAVPIYLISVCAVQHVIRPRVSALWQLALALCTAAVLIPSPLLEFRYFTVPYFFTRLHMPLAESRRALACELCMFVLINTITIWTFLNRPFEWDSEPGSLQRFMW